MTNQADSLRPERGRRWSWILALVALVVGVAGGVLAGSLQPFLIDVLVWRSFARDFLTSAGFGGAMAVVAAVVALTAALIASKRQRDQAEKDRDQRAWVDRKAQWWSRTEWALNATVDQNPEVAVMGQKMLLSQSRSPLADADDAGIIAAATFDVLGGVETENTDDADGDGPE